jgi:hypothetical protein
MATLLTSNKAPAKVDPLKPILLCVHVSVLSEKTSGACSQRERLHLRNLSDIIGHGIEQAFADVFW